MSDRSEDYRAGFRDALRLAVDAIYNNRDHNRRLAGHPFETYDEAIKRIYSTGFRRSDNIVTETAMMVEDAIDLYVVVPRGFADLKPT